MKSILTCSIAFILVTCSTQKDSGIVSATDSVQQGDTNTIIIAPDTCIYVGPVYALEGTSEFYTPLYGLSDVEIDFEKLSTNVIDSLIDWEGPDHVARRELPLEIAKRYFNLARLDRISVYSNDGKLVTDAVLARVELHDYEIDMEYVAVFKPMIPSWFKKDVMYCTTSSPDSFVIVDITSKEFVDKKLNESLFQQLGIDSAEVWSVRHIQFLKKNIFSVIKTRKKSYLMETEYGKSNVLYRTESGYILVDLLPTSIVMNGRPMLLARMSMDDTNAFWTSLLGWTSEGYKVVSRGRVEFR